MFQNQHPRCYGKGDKSQPYLVDSIGGDFLKSIFPKEVTVWDVVQIDGDQVSIFKSETVKRRLEVEKLLNEVWED